MTRRRRHARPAQQAGSGAQPAADNPPRGSAPGWYRTAVPLGLVLLLTAAAYSSSFANGFLNWDDPANVTQNPLIRAITWSNVAAYFTTPLLGMYTPLVYASFALDYLWSGLDPFAYHVTNLLLHLANVSLAFWATARLTKSRAAAILVAALFAVHPMNVAAVTPVSVRSSLLYSCFYLAAWVAYIRHVERGSRLSLWTSFALFVLAALSKSAAVVFPLLMILTDWFLAKPLSWTSVRQKLPFFVAAGVFGVVTFVYREDTAAMQSLPLFPFWERLLLAFYTLGFYVVKLLVPIGLSAHYPYPDRVAGHLPTLVSVSPFLVAAVAWLAWRPKAYRHVLVFGASFFLVHVLLVLKIVPLGAEFAADRYVYLPSIGLFLVVGEACRRWGRKAAIPVAALAAVPVLGLAVMAYGRSAVWHDNTRFYGDIIAKYPTAAVAYSNRGAALVRDASDAAGAVPDFDRAIRLDPGYADAYYNRATANMLLGRPGAALADVTKAIALRPGRSEYHQVSASARLALRDYRGAIGESDRAIALNPRGDDLYMAYESRGIAAVFLGDSAAAVRDFTTAISLNPRVAGLYQNRGNARALSGDNAGAMTDYDAAIRMVPSFSTAYRYRGMLKLRLGDRSGGCGDVRRAADLGLEAAQALLKQQCQ
jgi:protein O-mannosyl-transferase